MKVGENIEIGLGGVVFVDKHGKKLGGREALSKVFGRFFNILLDFELFLVHLVSFHVPLHSVRKMVFRLTGVKIGKGSSIHMGCKFYYPGKITIGEDTIVGDRAVLDGRASLVIGDHVDIASEVMIYNSEHDTADEGFVAREEPVRIGDYVFIGPRAIILPGVTIGRGAVIGAGAVVTRDVGDYKVVGGVPAREIGERKNRNLNYRLGRARLFQ